MQERFKQVFETLRGLRALRRRLKHPDAPRPGPEENALPTPMDLESALCDDNLEAVRRLLDALGVSNRRMLAANPKIVALLEAAPVFLTGRRGAVF